MEENREETTDFFSDDPENTPDAEPQDSEQELDGQADGSPETQGQPYGNNPQYGNPQYGNPQYGNQPYGNQQYNNQQYGNQQYGNQQYGGTYNPYGNPYYDNYNIQEYGNSYGGGFGIASLVLGIISILCTCTGLNVITGILAIVFGIIHISKHSGENVTAVIGFITSGLSLLLLIISLCFIIFGKWDDEDPDVYDYYRQNIEQEYDMDNPAIHGTENDKL